MQSLNIPPCPPFPFPVLKSPSKILELSSSSAGTLRFIHMHVACGPCTLSACPAHPSDRPIERCSTTRGYTSPLTATSEGESYLRLARTTGLLPPADQFMRVTTEDATLDSFQNILFSIARFREFTGAYPTRNTVVGHNFKHRRFEQLPRRATRCPELRFAYEGLLLRNEEDEHEAAAGEVRSFIYFF